MSIPVGRLGIKERLEWVPPGRPHLANRNEVVLVDDWSSVLEAIALGAGGSDERYDVLIAEFRLPGSPSFAAIHRVDPTFSVIDIDLLRGTSNTPMFDVGSEKLRRLAEWLTEQAGLTSTSSEALEVTEVASAERLDDEAPAETSDPDPLPPVSQALSDRPAITGSTELPKLDPPPAPRLVPTPSAHPVTQIALLARWLRLRLGLVLARAEVASLGLDFPGWTMTATRARALLGEDVAQASADELLDQWRHVDSQLEGQVKSAGHRPGDDSIGWIAQAFGLDRIERQILWLAAAPDMDGSFAQAIGFLNDDLAARRPTLSLLAQMIDDAGPPWEIQRRLAGEGPLARFCLVSLVRPDPLTPESLAPIVAAPDVVGMLLGRRPGDLVEGATLFDPADFREETFDLQVAAVLAAARGADDGARPVVHLHAPATEAGWLATQLASVDEPALVGDIGMAAGADSGELRERLYAFVRAARAADAVLIVKGLDELGEARRGELAEMLAERLAPQLKLLALQGVHTALTGLRVAAGGVLEICRPRPSRAERASIWMRAAAARGVSLSAEDAGEIAATFAFDRAQAEAAVALALGGGALETPETRDAALREGARIVSRASAPASVRRIETGLGWDDLILPAPIKAQLRSIPLQVKHAATVWEKWGFAERVPYGQATIALLAGPSGTGKTMAAQIIASELGAALFQIDLAKTVSKYIGETEKIVDRIFEAAADASAVLLFDEADALFGKRSDVRDAHDRFANIQVDYLLQRVEEHDGLILLTTNRKSSLDSGFLRRLSGVIDFPMPDEEHRVRIWEKMFPSDAPLGADVDCAAFNHLPLSGGGIVNSVLTAAFHAAEDGGTIRMRHLVAGVRCELAKSGMETAGRALTHLIDGSRVAGGAP